ncbi:MAG: hypothetical protein DRR00_21975 [Candidatus Parabeggiatoa sp. nov. 3]|nr:MAG: hypothetical protein DRR00_21975 [Gammaproteobacteria bacterium]
MPFQDIFVIQILGMLIAKKFSGIASFTIGNNQDEVAGVWFEQGMIVSVRYSTFSDTQALKMMAWKHHGELDLKPVPLAENPLANYSILVEELIAEAPTDVINTYPMLMKSFVTRMKLKPLKNSLLSVTGLTVFGQMSSGNQLIDIPRANLSEEAFWTGFWYLTCHGLVITSYANFLGMLVQQLQDELIKEMKKLMGAHIAKVYTEQLWQNIQRQWPDWAKGTQPDPIYGTSPYQFWTQMMLETTEQVGTPTLQKRCFKSALSTLSPEGTSVIDPFLSQIF